MMRLSFSALLAALLALLPHIASAQQADARDYELGYFAPNHTVALNVYGRHESSTERRSYSQSAGLFRLTHVMRKGDWGFSLVDFLMPVVDVTVYSPIAPSSPASAAVHGSGIGDLMWIPTIGYGLTQNATIHTHTWFAVTPYVTMPTGTYDRTALVNVGSNRWRVQPQAVIGQRFAKAFTLEAMVNVAFTSDNQAYRVPGQAIQGIASLYPAEQQPLVASVLSGDKTLSQKLSFGGALHAAMDLSPSMFLSTSYYLAVDGAKSVKGVPWSPDPDTRTIHTLRVGFGARVTPATVLLFQLNQDLASDGNAPITRGFFARVTHLFGLGSGPAQAAPSPKPAAKAEPASEPPARDPA
jgi:Putative MetA-pathway of phenol degradation